MSTRPGLQLRAHCQASASSRAATQTEMCSIKWVSTTTPLVQKPPKTTRHITLLFLNLPCKRNKATWFWEEPSFQLQPTFGCPQQQWCCTKMLLARQTPKAGHTGYLQHTTLPFITPDNETKQMLNHVFGTARIVAVYPASRGTQPCSSTQPALVFGDSSCVWTMVLGNKIQRMALETTTAVAKGARNW